MRAVKFLEVFSVFAKFSRFQSTMTKALVILSEGAEEMETVISVDVLRRGGVNVIFYAMTSASSCLPSCIVPYLY